LFCQLKVTPRAKAKLLWKDGNFAKGKKNIGHAIRYLLFGLQIIEHGIIVDFQISNPIYREIQSIGSDSYADYEKHFLPIFNNYFSKSGCTFFSCLVFKGFEMP
jgi:hypothetical protein